MNKFIASAVVAVAAFAAAPTFAADRISSEVGYVPQVSSAVSGLTREAVCADLLQAERNGTLPEYGEGAHTGALAAAKSTFTRDAMRSEAIYAVQYGQQLGGEV